MKDYLVRIISRHANVRGFACVTTHLVNEACKRHHTAPTASCALGRAMTGGALMGGLLKNDQRVALRFEGDGPLQKIVVEADSEGGIKGYVGVPDVELPLKDGKFDVAGALGHDGLLMVSKDLRLKEPYTGMVSLYTSEIGEDLAYYLTESEQIPSAVGLGVYVEPDGTVSTAGGFMIQSFPPYDQEMIDEIIDHIHRIAPVTDLVREGRDPKDLLDLVFEGIPYDILAHQDLTFRCTCSMERVEKALIILGRDEVAGLLEKYGEAVVKCEFCLETYHLGRKDLQRLLREMGPPRMLH